MSSSDGLRYYLTECCGASAKGLENYVGCRACYAEIDFALGGLPDAVMRYDPDATPKITFEPKPLALTEVYGDGIPYEQWKASR